MKRARRLIIIAIVLLVLVVAGSVAAIWWSNYQTSKRSQTNNSSGTSSAASFQEVPAEKTANQADKLAYEGDVQAGVKKLDEAIQNTTDKSELFIYYSRKATLLLNGNELTGALEAAKQAYDVNQLSEAAALVGQIAEQAGDKVTAVAYYQKAIDHIDQTDPYAKSNEQYYREKVTELGGAQ